MKKLLSLLLVVMLALPVLPAWAAQVVIQEPGAFSGGKLQPSGNQDSAGALVRNYTVTGDMAAIYVLPYLEMLMQEPEMTYMGCVTTDYGSYVGVYHWFKPKDDTCITFSFAENGIQNACLAIYYDRSGSYPGYNFILYCSPSFSIANKGAVLRHTDTQVVAAATAAPAATSSKSTSLAEAGFSFIPGDHSSNSSASSTSTSSSSSSSSSSSWSSSSSSSNYWSANRTKRCTRCSGDGKVSCSNCNGLGYKVKYGSTANYSGKSSTSYSTRENCYRCHGSGKVSCGTCGGSGKVSY